MVLGSKQLEEQKWEDKLNNQRNSLRFRKREHLIIADSYIKFALQKPVNKTHLQFTWDILSRCFASSLSFAFWKWECSFSSPGVSRYLSTASGVLAAVVGTRNRNLQKKAKISFKRNYEILHCKQPASRGTNTEIMYF